MRNLHLGLYTPNQEVPKHSGSLFHSTRATTEKKKILEEEFGVAMNEELEREVFVMCNLSQGVPDDQLLLYVFGLHTADAGRVGGV